MSLAFLQMKGEVVPCIESASATTLSRLTCRDSVDSLLVVDLMTALSMLRRKWQQQQQQPLPSLLSPSLSLPSTHAKLSASALRCMTQALCHLRRTTLLKPRVPDLSQTEYRNSLGPLQLQCHYDLCSVHSPPNPSPLFVHVSTPLSQMMESLAFLHCEPDTKWWSALMKVMEVSNN
jgi:hypothetical protein